MRVKFALYVEADDVDLEDLIDHLVENVQLEYEPEDGPMAASLSIEWDEHEEA